LVRTIQAAAGSFAAPSKREVVSQKGPGGRPRDSEVPMKGMWSVWAGGIGEAPMFGVKPALMVLLHF